MPVKRTKVVSKPVRKSASLSVPVYSLQGRAAGNLSLSKEVFGVNINNALLTQALRVYSFNQKKITASTKTRGEVKGTTAKMYRQKGTGRARHGAETAPIFVGGGIVFGPKPRKISLKLSQKMKKSALISALSSKVKDNEVIGLTGLEKAVGKTKEIVKLLDKINTKSALIVTDQKLDKVIRASNNLSQVKVQSVEMLNAYEVLKYQKLLLTKGAAEKLGAKS